MRPLLLASSSPHRRALLARLGVPFTWASPQVDETPLPGEAVAHYCARLARAKAQALADRHPDHLILGADQAAAWEGTMLRKPGDRATARAQLHRLAGHTLTFVTAVALYDAGSGRLLEASTEVEVEFRSLGDEEIERYLAREEVFDCVGAFRVEGLGIALFSRVTSDDPTALIGLPLIRVAELLRRMGVPVP
ncbi:MAG: Maf-like protein [Porticoccaceae bacterium]|nr:MAG: Maf-like protein [Porticoccaceae bacterium]